MKNKILLIQPPVRDYYCTPARLEPLGLEYLATAAKEAGWDAEILDGLYYKNPKSAPLPASMEYTREIHLSNDTSPFSLFRKFQHFGMSFNRLEEAVKDSTAAVVGISALFTPYQNEAIEVARIVKKTLPESIVILGGGFPTTLPEKVLKIPDVDGVILGEGEKPLKAVLKNITEGKTFSPVPGFGYKTEAGIRITAPETPDSTPARDVRFIPQKYQIGKQKWISLQTSRGCPNHCRFCSSKLLSPGEFRQANVMSVIQEMGQIQKILPSAAFNFEDDNLTYKREWTLSLCREIEKTFGYRKISLAAMNGICAQNLDNEVLRAMYRAGFSKLDLSLAVFDRDNQEKNARPFNTTEFIRKAREAIAAGMDVTAYLILGMPGQTTESIAYALRTLAAENLIIGPSVYYPTPGTELFNDCIENNYLDTEHPECWRSSAYPVETEGFSRLDIVTFMRGIRLINFLKTNASTHEIQSIMKSEIGSPGMFQPGLNKRETGMWLAGIMLKERSFFSMRNSGRDQIVIEQIPTSEKAFNLLFSKKKADWIHPVRQETRK